MTIKNPLKKEAPKTMTEALKKGLLNAGKIAFGLAVGFLFVHWRARWARPPSSWR